MKTKITTFIAAIVLLLIGTTAIVAQGTNVYFKKDGATVFQTVISDIDSIIFYNPVEIPDDPNVYDWEFAKKCALYSALAYEDARITGKSGDLETFFYTLGNLQPGQPIPTSTLPPKDMLFTTFLSNYKILKNSGEIVYFTGKQNDGYVKGDDYTPYVLQAQLKYENYNSITTCECYHDSDENNISYTLAYKEVNGGEILLAVILRGTDYVEWRGDMNVWKDKDTPSTRHFSFNNADSLMKIAINDYIRDNSLMDKSINLLITGHSRGAAVANLLAADENDQKWCNGDNVKVYAYTFATPNNTTLLFDSGYNNIFNFCFDDDFVPQVPLDTRFPGWSYSKNGINYHACAENLYNSLDTFKNLENRYIQLSESRNPSFNYQATQSVLQDFYSIADTVYDYYNKPLTMGPTIPIIQIGDYVLTFKEEDKTLYGFMTDYIANATIYGLWGDPAAAFGTVFKQLPWGNDVQKIADFFVDGFGAAPYINDTHQAFTYYNALISGKDNFSKVVDDGLTDDIHNIIPNEYIETLQELGLEIYGGNNPPFIEGTYLASPMQHIRSNFFEWGTYTYDEEITFYNQNNSDLTVLIDGRLFNLQGFIDNNGYSFEGNGAFIAGHDNVFSIFSKEVSLDIYGNTTEGVSVYSGELINGGIRNFQEAFIMVDDHGDPMNIYIENGQGRLDSNGFAEKINTELKSSHLSKTVSSSVKFGKGLKTMQ